MNKKISFVFFGSSPFSNIVLKELTLAGLAPTLVIDDATTPLSAKILKEKAPMGSWDMFVVASFGQIISADVLALPRRGSLNVHPSLLPKYRGPSPIQSAILADDRDTGVSIMLMDEQVDHGPILAQEKVSVPGWPPKYADLELILGQAGGKLLAETLPRWLSGDIMAAIQDDTAAAFTKKISKTDGELTFDVNTKIFTGDAYKNFLTIQAFSRWPKAHFFIDRKGKHQRIVITSASYTENTLTIERVIPEGKQEMNWPDFAKGYL